MYNHPDVKGINYRWRNMFIIELSPHYSFFLIMLIPVRSFIMSFTCAVWSESAGFLSWWFWRTNLHYKDPCTYKLKDSRCFYFQRTPHGCRWLVIQRTTTPSSTWAGARSTRTGWLPCLATSRSFSGILLAATSNGKLCTYLLCTMVWFNLLRKLRI